MRFPTHFVVAHILALRQVRHDITQAMEWLSVTRVSNIESCDLPLLTDLSAVVGSVHCDCGFAILATHLANTTTLFSELCAESHVLYPVW